MNTIGLLSDEFEIFKGKKRNLEPNGSQRICIDGEDNHFNEDEHDQEYIRYILGDKYDSIVNDEDQFRKSDLKKQSEYPTVKIEKLTEIIDEYDNNDTYLQNRIEHILTKEKHINDTLAHKYNENLPGEIGRGILAGLNKRNLKKSIKIESEVLTTHNSVIKGKQSDFENENSQKDSDTASLFTEKSNLFTVRGSINDVNLKRERSKIIDNNIKDLFVESDQIIKSCSIERMNLEIGDYIDEKPKVKRENMHSSSHYIDEKSTTNRESKHSSSNHIDEKTTVERERKHSSGDNIDEKLTVNRENKHSLEDFIDEKPIMKRESYSSSVIVKPKTGENVKNEVASNKSWKMKISASKQSTRLSPRLYTSIEPITNKDTSEILPIKPIDESKVEEEFNTNEEILDRMLKESESMVMKISRNDEEMSIISSRDTINGSIKTLVLDGNSLNKKISCCRVTPMTKQFKRKNMTFSDLQVKKIENENKNLEKRIRSVMGKSSGLSKNPSAKYSIEASSSINRRKLVAKTWEENSKIERKLRDIKKKANEKAPWAVPVWI